MKSICGRFVLAVALIASSPLPSFALKTPDAASPLTHQQERQIKEVKRANAEFFRALAEKDIVTFDERVADEGILCSSGRLQITSRLAFEKLMQSPAFKPMEVTIDESTVQLQSQTVVVLNNVTIQDISTSQMPKQRLYVMNIFVKRDGRWQVLASYSASEGLPSPPKLPPTG
ncbi:hypothetical protein IAD21_02990 [Abditibacteriota bacterium]|nr:hypothetical protein IAD21_02990 [Abditibacteriota bacterium]